MKRRRRRQYTTGEIPDTYKERFLDLWSELDRCPNRSETARRFEMTDKAVSEIYETLVGHAQVLKNDRIINRLSIDTDFLKRVYLSSLAGMSHKEAASVLGMTRQAFDRVLNDYPVVRDTWEAAKEQEVVRLIKSLRKRAHGFTQREKYISHYQGEIVEKDYRKRFPPDVTAINTMLLNLKKQWQLPNGVGTRTEDANRGRVLEHLENIIEEGVEKHGRETKNDRDDRRSA